MYIPLSKSHNKTAFSCLFSTGVQTVEKLLLSEGDSIGTAVQRCVSPQEDLGCCQQVSNPLQDTTLLFYSLIKRSSMEQSIDFKDTKC